MDYNSNYNKQQYPSNVSTRPFDKYPMGYAPRLNQSFLPQYSSDMKSMNYTQQSNVNNYNNLEHMMGNKMPALNFSKDLNMKQMLTMNGMNSNGGFNQTMGQYQQGMNSQVPPMYQQQSFMNNSMFPQHTFNSNNFKRSSLDQQGGSVFTTVVPNMQPEASKPTLLIPNINAVKKKTFEDEDFKDESAATVKYKKPNRIFIACTRCHKSKVRCVQLSDEEIAMLPDEHIKHMVQIMGVPNNISDPFNKSINKTSVKKGINYPCKRCYKSDKICVYDHSRIGRGRKPKKQNKLISPTRQASTEPTDSSFNVQPLSVLPINIKNEGTTPLETSTFKYVAEMKKQQHKLLDYERETKTDLKDYHLKEFMTISKTVTENLKIQLNRCLNVPQKKNFKEVNEILTDEDMDMENFDLIKKGLLTEEDCSKCFALFKTELLNLPQMRSLFDILFQMDWKTFKKNHPKLFYTIVSASFLVDKTQPDDDKKINVKSFMVNNAVLQMLFYYAAKKKLRTIEMFMCINILIVWDNMGHLVKWNEYADLMDIFKDYLNFIIEFKLPIQEFVEGNVDLSLDTDMNLFKYKKSNDIDSKPGNAKRIDPLVNMLLTESKYLELPCMSVILEISAFHLDDMMNGSSADQLIAQVSKIPVRDSTIHSYSEALRNSTSIYHQNLHILATMTHLFMDIMDSNQKFKGKTFEELKNMNYFETIDSQVSSINAYVYLIPTDNKRLRLCLHSMKAQILESVTEALLLSYAEVKHDYKKTEEFFNSIDDQTMSKIYEIIKYSKDCIVELDEMSDDLLKIIPHCYLARLSVCFEMILKLVKFGLTNTKRFEDLIVKVFEFSLNNVTMTYRCSDILKVYPSNFFLMRLQHVYTHAYMVLIEYVNEGIQNDKFFIDTTDVKLTKLMKQFDACYKNNCHIKNKLSKHADFFFKTLK